MEEAVIGTEISSKHGGLRIDFSVGMVVFPVHGSIGDEIIVHADKALYHAKKLGRDRVEISP